MNDRAEHVLVVEDDADSRGALRAVLELSGYHVHEAATGADAIAQATVARLDVVVLDVGLPDLDGYRVAAEIRRATGAACPFLIALTGYDRRDDRARADGAACDAYLLKPVEPDTLIALLRDRTRDGHRR